MKVLDKLISSGRFNWPWWAWLSQGLFILLLGLILAFGSIFNPDVAILSTSEFSWLPICGMIIIGLGLLECFDAFFAKEICDLMQRINGGVLDTIFGTLLLFGLDDSPGRLGLMIALYLIVRSILRAIFSIVLKVSHLKFTLFSCLITLVLGLMIWTKWPFNESWFFAFSLSIEIFFRGLSLVCFASFIKTNLLHQKTDIEI
jgi:uncharacterized membrane protein HdeD (DUF308 family)